jgi:hypothetical protein
MLGIAIYAIRDTRKQAFKMILLDRNRFYARIRNDMAWLFIDPTDYARKSEIAKGLEEFCITAQEAEPKWTIEDLKGAVENEALHFAATLVKSGYATWKAELDVAAVEQRLLEWQTDKNRERIHNLFKNKEKIFLL